MNEDVTILNKSEVDNDDIIDWNGIIEFNKGGQNVWGGSIFERAKEGIYDRIVKGLPVTKIAEELTIAAKLAVPIKHASLRTWLYRKQISCRKLQKEGYKSSYLNSEPMRPESTKPPASEAKFSRQVGLGASLRTAMEEKLNTKWNKK